VGDPEIAKSATGYIKEIQGQSNGEYATKVSI